MQQWSLAFLFITFLSCKEPEHPKTDNLTADSSLTLSFPTKDTAPPILYKSALNTGHKVPANKVFTDTVTFVERNDNGDYFLFYIRKKNRLVSLIYDDLAEQPLNYLRGDTLEIQWKIDSMWIAGDDEKLAFKERLVHVKKISDGKVSAFRKLYTKPIKYWYAQDTDYSNDFKDYLYLLVEYYIAYSRQPLVLLHLQNPEKTDFVYSIEERNEKGRHYIVLGLSNDQGTHANIIQWLYLDSETHAFYEYDLANDKLIPFP